MNKEIGGYIELEKFRGKMLYDDGVKLNCGRNALLYLIKTKGIDKILVPKFMCGSNDKVLKTNNVEVRYYNIDINFKPIVNKRDNNEWLYLVNYYGQISSEFIKTLGNKLIVDNAQAYFHKPINGFDTIYACRKFFGVSDGAILFTNKFLDNLPVDESRQRMNFLLGRFERSASEFYEEYVKNNENFDNEPLKKMSKLTENILHAIDYEYVKKIRKDNFSFLHSKLATYNKLNIVVPEGAFMYPLYIENGERIRNELKKKKIYIPMLWPDVLDVCNENDLEYDLAKNILPLPVDQRYGIEDMKYIVDEVVSAM